VKASWIIVVEEVDAAAGIGSPVVPDAGFSMVVEAEKVEEPSASCAGCLLKAAWLMVQRRRNFVRGLRKGDQGRGIRFTSYPQRLKAPAPHRQHFHVFCPHYQLGRAQSTSSAIVILQLKSGHWKDALRFPQAPWALCAVEGEKRTT
jgi:hypothetical protein